MTDSALLQKTRRLLLGLAVMMFGMTIVELILVDHVGDAVQLLPFLCCGLGIAAVAYVWKRPEPRGLQIYRAIMSVILVASVFGIGEHIWSALQMTRDFHPGIAGFELWKTALTSSVPILAPGALAAGALVALIGTYGLQTQPAPELARSSQSLRRA